MTVHGQSIEGMPELDSGRTIDGKQYIYVYFASGDENNERPYLICLQDNSGSGKTWYERVNKPGGGYEWKNADNTFSAENPDTIDNKFADKLDDIKQTLNGSSGKEDTGYTKLVSILIINTCNFHRQMVGGRELKKEASTASGTEVEVVM